MRFFSLIILLSFPVYLSLVFQSFAAARSVAVSFDAAKKILFVDGKPVLRAADSGALELLVDEGRFRFATVDPSGRIRRLLNRERDSFGDLVVQDDGQILKYSASNPDRVLVRIHPNKGLMRYKSDASGDLHTLIQKDGSIVREIKRSRKPPLKIEMAARENKLQYGDVEVSNNKITKSLPAPEGRRQMLVDGHRLYMDEARPGIEPYRITLSPDPLEPPLKMENSRVKAAQERKSRAMVVDFKEEAGPLDGERVRLFPDGGASIQRQIPDAPGSIHSNYKSDIIVGTRGGITKQAMRVGERFPYTRVNKNGVVKFFNEDDSVRYILVGDQIHAPSGVYRFEPQHGVMQKEVDGMWTLHAQEPVEKPISFSAEAAAKAGRAEL